MKFIKTIFLILFLCMSVESSAFFYTNNFNAPLDSAEWTTNFRYGMEGLNNDTNLISYSILYTANGFLIITNDPYFTTTANIPTWTYNGFWTGNSVRLEKKFTASATNPFGFDVKRVFSDIDADANQGNPNSMSERSQAQLDIWLVDGSKSIANMWDTYDNFFLLFENGMRGPNAGTMPPNHISQWGYFDGAAHHFDFSYCTNAYGEQINLTNHSIHSLNWQYNWIGDTSTERDASHLYASSHYPNTNEYIFRVTHDGTYLTVYINPDPDDNDAYPNEFCKVFQKKVLWNDNLQILLGHEVRNYKEHHRDVKYDFLRIVSAADESKVFLDPEILTPDNIENKFVFSFQNKITPVNAGINYVEIEIPLGFSFPDNFIRNLCIQNDYNINLTPVAFCQGEHYPNSSEVSVRRINEHRLGFIFGTPVKYSKISEKREFQISFNLKYKYADIHDEDQFQVFVENRQFDKMPSTWGKSSTCGLQKCAGNLKIYKKQFNISIK